LDSGSVALTCAFNRHGTLLAVGCNDGRVAIWDFLTRGVTKTHANHVHPVCCLSWSRNGRLLLSSATDFTVCVTDVLTGDLIVRYHFPSVVNKVQFHPRNNSVFLACPMKHSPVIVDIVKDSHQAAPTNGEVGYLHFLINHQQCIAQC
jgi:COMPASS component SWD1